MKQNKIDLILATAIILLIMFGLLMVFGASSMVANTNFGSLTHFFRKQVLWGIVTIGLIISVSKVDYKMFKNDGLPVLLILLSLILLCGLFFFGTQIKGATRWYSLGLFNFQPSEMARIALIIYLSHALSRTGDDIMDFKNGLLPKIIVLLLVVIPVVLQPDLSTSLMACLVACGLFYIAGARVAHMLALALPVIPGVILMMTMRNYQWRRVESWIHSLSDPMNAVYQIKQSLIGLGRGGLTGVGIGESKQKFLFLPDSHTDFIFSIIGEEFGFIGTSAVLILFMVILVRGIRLAKITRDPFGQFLAAGITLNIVSYAFINAAVVTNLMPATGLPMPFISYGGSHLVFLGVSAGILLNISRHAGTESWEDFREKRMSLAKTIIRSD